MFKRNHELSKYDRKRRGYVRSATRGRTVRSYEKSYARKTAYETRKGKKYAEFQRLGGGRSGVYDVSDRRTAAFVKKYREFIPDKEIYRRDARGHLVPVYRDRK